MRNVIADGVLHSSKKSSAVLRHMHVHGGTSRTTSLLPTLCGRILKTDQISFDTFHAPSKIFSCVAAAENEFLNLIEVTKAAEVATPGNEKQDVVVSLHDLLHNKRLVSRRISNLKEILESVMMAGCPAWPKLSEQRGGIINILAKDFTHLLRKAKSLSQLCEHSISTLMYATSILESQSAFKQSESVANLTKLAFLFLPLSFTASFFGMSFGELDTVGQLDIRLWSVVSAPITLLSALSIGLFPNLVKRHSTRCGAILARAIEWSRGMFHHLK